MGSHAIWVTIIVAFQISAVLGRNNYYEYYYSRYHHKSHSTTAALSPSTTDISPELKTESSVSADFLPTSHRNGTIHSYDNDLLENIKHMSTADFVPTPHRNGTIHSYGYEYDDNVQYTFALKVGLIVGCSILFLVCSCCIFCCIRVCGRRNEFHRGFIIGANIQRPGAVVCPQQPIVSHPTVGAYQYPPPQYQEERAQLFPPQYQPQIMQQQYPPVQHQDYQSQCSPTAPHDHNPPEAPPPYEFPQKF